MSLITDALARQNSVQPKPVDWQRMKDVRPSQKAALTRAVKNGDPEQIAIVCKAAVAEWDGIGAWPDDWSNWQRALNDALPWHQQGIDIADL